MTRWIIGVDLGTTNCALACVERKRGGSGEVVSLPVLQRVSETQVAERRTLPSFLYIPGEHELPPSALALPWAADASAVVGEFARAQGARVPVRLVASAKSWLCHPRADRTAPILPWEAPPGTDRVSPLEASARYLLNLRESWNHTHSARERFQDQEIVLCVPASFNEVARELTLQAAALAGLERVTLLEEPQAAFYAWLDRHRNTWPEALRDARGILVCDVGGGTTDFTLIRVADGAAGTPTLKRVAVGEHLMLGGDNMDQALAHVVEQALGARFDARSWGILVYECRAAKERLLGADAPEEWTVAIPGSGSRLLAGMTSAPLLRDDVRQIVLEGFFPLCGYGDEPETGRRAALSEWGLPYAADPAVTRHLAAFLRHQGHLADARDIPDAVLFNGAALEPALLRERVCEAMERWSGARPRELPNAELDLAVARGAACFGWIREHGGLRIGGGTARAYYVGVALSDGAAPPRAACLIPRGLEEGEAVEIREPEFRVLVDRPVAFPLFASSTRQGDAPGSVVALEPSEAFESLPPLTTVLGTRRRDPLRARRGPQDRRGAEREAAAGTVAASPSVAAVVAAAGTLAASPSVTAVVAAAGTVAASPSVAAGARDAADSPPVEFEIPADSDEEVGELPAIPEIPVHLRARMTEIGTLELWCVGADASQKWRLQFQLRGGEAPTAALPGVPVAAAEDPTAVRAACDLAGRVFRTRAGRLEQAPVKPRGLMWALEELLRRKREEWSPGMLRELWETLDRVRGRRRSGPDFEGAWLNACGFALRPGFGYPLDDWRINRTWEIFDTALQFPKSPTSRLEWWVMWRRLAGGLDRVRQQEVFAQLAPALLPGRKHMKTRLGPPASSAETTEVLRLAASLERLDPEVKAALGNAALARLRKRPATLEFWMLARLGARAPLVASPHHCVPPEVAQRWIGEVLEVPWKDARMAALAVVQLGRLVGDRARDLDEDVREQAARRLLERGMPELAPPLREVVALQAAEQAVVVGDSIPIGLRLLG